MSADGRTLWLKWAANFAGCRKGLDCSGAYGFNVAQVRLATPAKAPAKAKAAVATRPHKARKLLIVVPGLALPLLLLLFVWARPGVRDGLRRPTGGSRGQ
jgi:hypothetical protein